MLYGKVLYGAYVYNGEVLFVHGVVEVSVSTSAARVATASAVGAAECLAVVSSAVVYVSSVTAAVAVSGASAGVQVVPCQAASSASVSGSVARTRVKYASLGQAVAIRAAYNDGIRVVSAGVLYAAQGSLEWVVQPYSVVSSYTRYLFDGGGVAGQNLAAVVLPSGHVRVVCGSAVIDSSNTVSGDGATVVGVGWDSSGVELYLDGQRVAYSTQQFTLSLGTYFYVGCSASQAYSLDGLLTEFRVSSRKRSAAEHAAVYELIQLGVPLGWDIDTTYLLHFDGNLSIPADRQGVWVSPVMDASQAVDRVPTVLWQDEIGTDSAIVCQVRTSPDGQSWSMWYDQVNGEQSGAPENPYVQVRFILQVVNNASTPVLHSASIVFEGLPGAELLASGLAQATSYGFAQLQDWLIITNGADLPQKYDGEVISAVASAPRGKVCCVYRNRVWTARGNTLYFSDLLSVDGWPVANFIMVNPSDGDEIMALIPTSMLLIVVKQRSTYYLQGYSPDTFEVSPAIDGGAVAPYGAVWTPVGVFMVDRDGVWLTDLRKRVNLTRPIQSRWYELNQRGLHRAALLYKDELLLVAVPDAGSAANNVILVYDAYHKVWVGEWTGWKAACFLQFWESGKWKYLFGDASSGNVGEIGGLATDNGSPFEALVETAHLALMSEEWIKRLKWVDVYLATDESAGDVEVGFVVDGEATGYRQVFVYGGVTAVGAARFYPPPYAHVIGVRVRWPQAEYGEPELLGMSLVSYPRAPRPVEVV